MGENLCQLLLYVAFCSPSYVLRMDCATNPRHCSALLRKKHQASKIYRGRLQRVCVCVGGWYEGRGQWDEGRKRLKHSLFETVTAIPNTLYVDF